MTDANKTQNDMILSQFKSKMLQQMDSNMRNGIGTDYNTTAVGVPKAKNQFSKPGRQRSLNEMC